jgi:hypothetical protein
MLERIKLLLNVTGEDKLIEELIKLNTAKVLERIKEDEVPNKFEFIVIESVISRYNRIGSEGLKSESVDGRVQTYEGDIEPYYPILDDYVEEKKKKTDKGYRLL